MGLICGIGLEVKDVAFNLTEPWLEALQRGDLNETDLPRVLAELNNVRYEIRIHAQMMEPPRGHEWLQAWTGVR